MKHQINLFDSQISSLRETTSTRQQILEKIQLSSMKELKAIIPSIPDDYDLGSIRNNAEQILNAPELPDFKDLITESIIQYFGRPAYLIKNDLPVLSGEDMPKYAELVNNAESMLNLSESIRCFGRIETENLPGFSWVGTGWLFAEDKIMTNRHVAKLFAAASGKAFKFSTFMGQIVAPRIDFLAEYENDQAAEFQISECLYIAGDKDPDVAVLRVKFKDGADYRPLELYSLELKAREDIAVIGYPAYDSRVSSVEDMERIYNRIYDFKRFAPGKVTGVYTDKGLGMHDCSTLGGNSGSGIYSLETGKILGLHFGGIDSKGNYFVSGAVLKKIIDKLPESAGVVLSASSSNFNLPEQILTEMVGRQCKLKDYAKITVPSFKISGRIITFASPDSTYSVTKKLFMQAKESILIGIYDLSAEHMVVLINDAIDRGVKVTLMLDIDSPKEQQIFDNLKKYGVTCVPAPSCASKNVHYFSSSHEKVIVIDEIWTFIQSGNYSNNSIPLNEGDGVIMAHFKVGNRDMGIAIESGSLARFFTKLLLSDMQLEKDAVTEEGLQARLPQGEFLIEAPQRIPDPLFASHTFNFSSSITVQPVLSPDNYMQLIPGVLASAKKSIRIEQQYIRVNQPQIKILLASIPKDVDVQIIVAPPIGDPKKTQEEARVLQEEYGFQVRLLSKKHFVHCHNKLIIIDDSQVLISSQNWSDSAVAKNREAGVLIDNAEITAYYARIFEADWTMSDVEVVEESVLELSTDLHDFGSQPGKYIRIDAGDIQDV